VDEALVENAQHEVDHQDRDEQEHALAPERGLEGLRGAWKLPITVAGIPRSRWARLTSSTAWLRATPGARLNEIVTDGSWPRCVMVSGPMVGVSRATELSGTSLPEDERT